MAHSDHTDKEWVQAWRLMPRDDDGAIVYPRVVVRKPRPGDIHSLPRRDWPLLLRCLPLEYLYGLRCNPRRNTGAVRR
jgi:hypothetical protein